MNVAKIHRKLMITESQFYFTNISATKARIFMKFYVVVNYYLMSLSFKFYDDPCIDARIRGENARTRDILCTRMITTRFGVFMHKYSKNLKYKLTR